MDYPSLINVKENRRSNQEWTIHRGWQHGCTRHRTNTNKHNTENQKDEQRGPHAPNPGGEPRYS